MLRWELIGRTPVDVTRPPRAEKLKLDLIPFASLQGLLEVADEFDIGPLVRLAVLTGMRRGGLLALRWHDVNFEKGTLTVRDSKTKAGERLLAAGPDTLALLRRARRA